MLCHICLRSHTEQPALFSGDTLFNAGAGNCHNGGNVEALYTSFAEQISRLPDDTQVYAGHDYIENMERLLRKFDTAKELVPQPVVAAAPEAVAAAPVVAVPLVAVPLAVVVP